MRGNTDYDVTILRLDLAVPSTANCLSLDFRFLSEEYPEWVGSRFNDAFLAEVMVAELDRSTWTTSGSSISAPDNFAFDPEGNPISINATGVTSMTRDEAAGTTYDGATPLLEATTPVTPGQHRLFLSIFDQGDRVLDSAVLLDNLRAFRVGDPSTQCRPGADVAGNGPAVWEDWHYGDVHTHAAGDDNLIIHPQCEDRRSEAQCAAYLVDNVLRRATRFDTDFVIFTEHGPWLGYQKHNTPEFYNRNQAERGWGLIKDELDRQSTSEIRGLIGEELGTAAPACMVADRDNSPLPFRSSGHFGVYYAPQYVDNSIVDCNETGDNGYAGDPQALGGWGAINHPDNGDGGSPWHCYNTGTYLVDGFWPWQDDKWVTGGLEHQPQMFRSKRCPVGVDAYAAKSAVDNRSFRSMEIVNGEHLPSAKTLGLWDQFLQNGYRIAAVGGGDGHTAPRKAQIGDIATCAVQVKVGLKELSECIDDAAPESTANHNKVGGSGRTLAHYPAAEDLVTPGTYDSNDPDDPARAAIRSGRTVATNGPKVTAQVGGQFPGGAATVPEGQKIPVRIDWVPQFTSVGETHQPNYSKLLDNNFEEFPDGTSESNTVARMHRHAELPDRLVVVTGSRKGCGTDRFRCGAKVTRKTITLDAEGATTASDVTVHAAESWAEVLVEPPGPDGYVRVEAYYDVEDPNPLNTERDRDDDDYPRFIDNREFDYAAFTSPIYVQERATARITGKVVDGVAGAAVAGAGVELCRTGGSGAPLCVTRTTRTDGTFQPVDSSAGTWTARAFPPSGVTDRDVAALSLGTVSANTTRDITLSLPLRTANPYIDPSGTVVDTDGNPVEGASVQLWAAPSWDGSFTLVPDGDVVMSPANRRNPVTTDQSGIFAWDVLAGYYRVTATKAGCRSVVGGGAADSGALVIPPPALGIELVLDCRPPDSNDPTLTVTSPPPAATNGAVTVAFEAGDDQPGVVTYCFVDGGPEAHGHDDHDDEVGPEPFSGPCVSPLTVSGLGEGAHRIAVVAIDARDNFTATEMSFLVDTTPPLVSVSGVTDGGTYTLDDDQPAPACSASDALSGLAAPCSGMLTSPPGGVGTFSYTATATDRAGNTASATVTWRVVYPFTGFFDPVSNLPATNRITAGRAVPVKFGLGGDRGLGVLAAGWPRSVTVPCDATAPVDVIEETTTAGNSSLSYDPATGVYTYVWKTLPEWAGSCRQFTLRLADGTEHHLRFELR